MEETVRAFNHVIEKGWAFYWGTSQWSADEVSEACGIARALGLVAPTVEQPLYNMLDRTKVEGEFQRLYSRCGIGLTTFSPLKMGLLSGKYNDATTQPPPGSRFAESNDGFADSVRKYWENEQWSGTIKKVVKLKVRLSAAPGSNRGKQLTGNVLADTVRQTRFQALPAHAGMVPEERKRLIRYHRCLETGAGSRQCPESQALAQVDTGSHCGN